MKLKQIAIAIVVVTTAQSVVASGIDPGLASSLIISISPAATSDASSGGFNNDILMVKQDAIIAMETRVISEALASVMEKMQTVDSPYLGMTDEQLIKVIINSN